MVIGYSIYMPTMLNSFWETIKKYIVLKAVYIPLIIITVIAGWTLTSGGTEKNLETTAVSKIPFDQRVSVTGTVVSAENVDMSFESGGRVGTVAVKVGDRVKAGTRLASVNSGDEYATYLRASATLEAERARLTALYAGTRPEELRIAETSYRNTEDAYKRAQNALSSAVINSFVVSDGAIKSKVDQLFTDGRAAGSEFISISDYDLRQDINNQYPVIKRILREWNEQVNLAYSSTSIGYSDEAVDKAKENLSTIRTFLDMVGRGVVLIKPSDITSQNTIDTYKSNIASARASITDLETSIANSEISLQTAESNLRNAKEELDLKKAGARPEDIQAQEAVVKSAQASVLSAQAILGQKSITAPFDGIVTKVDAKVGEIVSPSVNVIAMISDAKFEIESYIPEANVAKVKLNQEAEVWLDAYGPDTKFKAVVTSVDPAETIKEGISTYKTKLQFTEMDERIKSGMTANTVIKTDNRDGVLAIPGKAIVSTESGKIVYVVKDGNKKEVKARNIFVGGTDSAGNTEVINGLSQGEIIVTNPTEVDAQ